MPTNKEQTMSIDLSIVTVTYCSEKQIEALIRSVEKGCRKISYEHIIVDNASSDQTVNKILSFGNAVKCIKNDTNLGFSAANIIGYNLSKGKYLLFLNPDMEVEPEGLDKIVERMEANPNAGIMGCQLLDMSGKINPEAVPRRFPRLHEQFIILLKLKHFFPYSLDRYFYRDLDLNQEQTVDTVRGSFMVMRQEFIKTLGWPFDPRYYIWFEDVDVCREAQRRGFSVIYTPCVKAKDAIGQSFRQRNRSWRFRQYAQSLFRYFKKWEPFYIWCWIPLLYMPLAYLIGKQTIYRKTFKS